MYRLLLMTMMAMLFPWQGHAAVLNLAIQPILPKDQMEASFAPLAKYLSQASGHEIRVIASSNFLSYWESMRRSTDYHLVLDAAHFTDFRIKRHNYQVLAKINDTVSMSLITNENTFLLDQNEIIGSSIATVPSPSLSGVRLSQLFPNPLRQPAVVATNNFQEALQKLKNNQVKAALVPTPMISGDTNVNVILTTEPVPHMAFSASPLVDASTRESIRSALIQANKTEQGRSMLSKINISGFEPASNETYRGLDRLLEGVWGY